MNADNDWVEDVKRWVRSDRGLASPSSTVDDEEMSAIGYEAAHPALQARHWPEAQRGFADSTI